MRIGRRLAAVALVLLFIGCVSMFSGMIFSTPNGEVNAKGKTVAVVPAFDTDMTVAVAQSMTRSLAKTSTFKVMPAGSVKQRIGDFPPLIKGPWTSAEMTIDEDYTKTDFKKVKEVMKKLGTEYAYFIWSPTGYSRTASKAGAGTSGEGRVYWCIAQLFQGPNAKVVGQGKFTVTSTRAVPGATVSDKEIQEAIVNTTDTVAKIIEEKTKTIKE